MVNSLLGHPVVITYLLVLVGCFLLVRFIAPSQTRFLRILFPSWRFFEDLVEVPRLYVRAGLQAGELGDWHLCLQPPVRKARDLFVNSDGNFQFAASNLLDQLASDLESLSPVELQKSVSYHLVKKISAFEIETIKQNLLQEGLKAEKLEIDELLAHAVEFYQFKIVFVMQGTSESRDALISPVFGVDDDSH